MVKGRDGDEEELLSDSSDSSSSESGRSDGSQEAKRPRPRRPLPPSSQNQTAILLVVGFLVLAVLLFAGFKAWENMSGSAADDTSVSATLTTTRSGSAMGGSTGSGSTGTKGTGDTLTTSATSKPTTKTDAVGGTTGKSSSPSSSPSPKATGGGGGTDGHPTPADLEQTTATKKTAAPAAATPASNNAPSGGKKGVGYNKVEYTKDLKISWGYNWASLSDPLPSGTFIPMLWGEKSLKDWSTNAQKGIDAGADYILGFNEPDHPEQASMTPQKAVDLWRTEIAPFGSKVKLVSPGVTNGVGTADAPMGVPWLQQFLQLCSGCQIEAVALHWYDKASNIDYFKKYFTESHTKLQKPIWITEFMGLGTPDEQIAFLKEVVPWLEQQDFVQRYAAFGDFADNPVANFVDAGGALLPLGQAYADLP